MAEMTQVVVPDIGDFTDVPVIELLVAEGDSVDVDAPLVTLESDKATMEIPAPVAGVIDKLLVKLGDKVSEGTPIATIEGGNGAAPAGEPPLEAEPRPADPPTVVGAGDASSASAGEAASAEAASAGAASAEAASAEAASAEAASAEAASAEAASAEASSAGAASAGGASAPSPASAPPAPALGDEPAPYASPLARRIARERGVDLASVHGTGRNGRIVRADVEAAASAPAPAAAPGGPALAGLAPWPTPDFAKYGEIERVPLTRIQKISGPNLARNWVMIPHVTHHEEADITGLEEFRKQINKENPETKVTMVALLMKAVIASLKEFPAFNSSLDGEELIYKHYWNIGFAADTPQGLMVPVIKNVDQKGLLQVAGELRDLSGKAREGKIMPADLAGATFTISSLGGIGGTGFTPIVNAPEVAILGVTRSAMKPVWNGSAFEPRLMVPLSLSYDHRVIDGALAARFMVHLKSVLEDMRRTML